MKSAAGQMDLGKFRWLRAHGCQEEPGPIGESAAAEAASNGCADLLAESLAGRDLADEAVWRPLLDLAARADKLTTVRWLAHSGVPLDSPLEGERNLLEAAGGDNLRGEVFPWLLERIPVDALRLRRLAAMLEAVHPWKRGTFEPLLRQCQARLDREALDASALAAPASKPAVRI